MVDRDRRGKKWQRGPVAASDYGRLTFSSRKSARTGWDGAREAVGASRLFRRDAAAFDRYCELTIMAYRCLAIGGTTD